MKTRITFFAIAAVLILGLFSACSSPVGMWMNNGETNQYLLTLDKNNEFEYVILTNNFYIVNSYRGTYELDKKAKTITLQATTKFDGFKSDTDPFSWRVENTWLDTNEVFTFPYEMDGKNLVITMADNTTVTLEEREQPIELMRSLQSE